MTLLKSIIYLLLFIGSALKPVQAHFFFFFFCFLNRLDEIVVSSQDITYMAVQRFYEPHYLP